jgi:hypothetical protein
MSYHPVHDAMNITQNSKDQFVIQHRLSGKTYKNCYTSKEAASLECERIIAAWQPSDLNFKFIKNAGNCVLV